MGEGGAGEGREAGLRGAVTVDADGAVRDCDEAFARMVGLPAEGLRGRLICDLLAPDRAALAERERLVSQVEALVAELQDAIESRDEFLSVASHELKTPLTALQLQIEGILRAATRGGVALPAPVTDRLAAVARQGRRMTQLVNGLLDVSRIRAGRLEFTLEPVDLAQVARDAAERFRHEAGEAGCALSVEARGPVVGAWDRLRLEQVAANLVSNALKYGKGRPVAVRAWQAEGAGWLSVSDQGIGIAPELQERIFERFGRAVSSREYGGLGLGLWISREIVSRLGGAVRVASAPGQGASFTVVLPLPARGGEVEPPAGP